MIKKIKLGSRIIFIAFIPLGLLLSYAASYNPLLIENIYSNKVDKFIRQILSIVSGIFPFSLGEILLILLIAAFVYYGMLTIFFLIKGKKERKKIIIDFILNTLAVSGCIYLSFLLTWGLNYYRLPFSTIAKYDTRPASVAELGDLCQDLVNRSNDLREKVNENQKGIMYITGGIERVFLRASYGYDSLSAVYPQLGGTYGRSKGVILSKVLCYQGISGIYSPFTGESNVNIELPDLLVPFSVCHEMAHQRGFAREDEANFIAYQACNKNPDYDFKYSGTLFALISSMDTLSTRDPQLFKTLYSRYSDDVLRDVRNMGQFWNQYEGPIERISRAVNDQYLKFTTRKEGIKSYGKMVDLLISERRQKIKREP